MRKKKKKKKRKLDWSRSRGKEQRNEIGKERCGNSSCLLLLLLAHCEPALTGPVLTHRMRLHPSEQPRKAVRLANSS